MLHYFILGSLTFLSQLPQPPVRFTMVEEGLHLQLVTADGASAQLDLSSQLFGASEVLDVFVTSSSGQNYALLSVGFRSKKEQATSGFCANGYEEQWVWLSYDAELLDITPQVFAGGSCLRGIYPDLLQDGQSLATLSDLSTSFEEIEISIEQEDDTSTYVWSSTRIDSGFERVE